MEKDTITNTEHLFNNICCKHLMCKAMRLFAFIFSMSICHMMMQHKKQIFLATKTIYFTITKWLFDINLLGGIHTIKTKPILPYFSVFCYQWQNTTQRTVRHLPLLLSKLLEKQQNLNLCKTYLVKNYTGNHKLHKSTSCMR